MKKPRSERVPVLPQQSLTAYLEGHIQVRPDEDSLALELGLVKIVQAGLAVGGGGGLGLGAGGSIALHSSERGLGSMQCILLLRSGFAVTVDNDAGSTALHLLIRMITDLHLNPLRRM